MLSVRRLIQKVGDPIRAQAVLLKHYAEKQSLRHNWDRRYSAMKFVVRFAPRFRKDAEWLPAAEH